MKPEQMIRDAMFLLQKAARLDGISEELAVAAKAAWADLHWALEPKKQPGKQSQPQGNNLLIQMGAADAEKAALMAEMPEFKGLICRGSYALGSACGNCERCEWERKKAGWSNG